MTETQSSRFKDAIWFPKEQEFTVVGGSGGIGSWLSVLLARVGITPIVYDFDTIEEHNMGGQLFGKTSIGKKKVDAIKHIIKDLCDTDIHAIDEKFTENSMSHIFMFSGFDNMKARTDMFNVWSNYVDTLSEEDKNKAIFIDGRLSAEQMQIFCVTPDRREQYKEHLFDDSEVADAPCTLKQTSHAAAMIASHMVGFFTNHYANIVTGEKDRSVPFYWEYFIPINYITEE